MRIRLRRVRNRLSNLTTELNRLLKLGTHTDRSHSYFPDADRKSKLRILADLLVWLVRYREVNRFYFVYGLDRKDARADRLLGYRKFRALRNRANLRPRTSVYSHKGHNYACLTRDKFVFSQYVASLGFPTPRNLALLTAESVRWLATGETAALDSLVAAPAAEIDGFAKPLDGVMGRSAFPLKVRQGRLFAGDEVSLEWLRSNLAGPHLWQERIIQHPSLSTLYPHAINTVRIVTFNIASEIQVFSAVLRAGTGRRFTDNWASGGIIVRVDLETGRLAGKGLFKPTFGLSTAVHPDTGVPLDGFEIPHLTRAVQLVRELHRFFYGLHSIGWDIAITEDGPIVIEGNDDWDGSLQMALEDRFRERFLEMYTPREKERVQ